MNLKYYLDKRNGEEPFPLKLVISHKGKTALLPVDVRLNEKQFNADKERVENHPNKVFLNNFITQRKIDVQEIILKTDRKKISLMSATEIKNLIKSELSEVECAKTIGVVYDELIGTKHEKTAKIFSCMRSKLIEFEPKSMDMAFDSIDNKFIQRFYDFLISKINLNSAAIYIQKLQNLFHYAIDSEITNNYPFRKLKIKYSSTKKRDLSIEQLRYIFTNDFGRFQKGVDCFKLVFYLIGINQIDLFHLESISNKGRIEYDRHKTGKHYSVLVPKEAKEIIDKYGFNFGYKSFKSFYTTIRNHLTIVGEDPIIGVPLTLYWARHSWASIASDLDFSRDVIAHGLGHGNNTITDIYIDFNIKKVDKANRVIIDYVLGKSENKS